MTPRHSRSAQRTEVPAPPDLWSLYISVDLSGNSERARAWRKIIDLLSVEFADALSVEPSVLVIEQIVAICLQHLFNGWHPGSTVSALHQVMSLLKQYEPLVGALPDQPETDADYAR